MHEQPEPLSFEEFQKKAKTASSKSLGEQLTYSDLMRQKMALFTLRNLITVVAAAAVYHTFENQLVEGVALGSGAVSAWLSIVSTQRFLEANTVGNEITNELQNRGIKVSRGLVRKIVRR